MILGVRIRQMQCLMGSGLLFTKLFSSLHIVWWFLFSVLVFVVTLLFHF